MTWDPIHNYCNQCGQFMAAEEAQDCPEAPFCRVLETIAADYRPPGSTVWIWTDQATDADWAACRRGELTIVDPGGPVDGVPL
jgi:hypothetical protein